jgi:hypothetical protein
MSEETKEKERWGTKRGESILANIGTTLV